MAEVDDNVITWKNFKVFHTRNMKMDTMGGDGWNVMMWNERSLQDSAQNGSSGGSRASMSTGAIIRTMMVVLVVAVMVSGLVAFSLTRKSRKLLGQSPLMYLAYILCMTYTSHQYAECMHAIICSQMACIVHSTEIMGAYYITELSFFTAFTQHIQRIPEMA